MLPITVAIKEVCQKQDSLNLENVHYVKGYRGVLRIIMLCTLSILSILLYEHKHLYKYKYLLAKENSNNTASTGDYNATFMVIIIQM